jgi:hypothetical protein
MNDIEALGSVVNIMTPGKLFFAQDTLLPGANPCLIAIG